MNGLPPRLPRGRGPQAVALLALALAGAALLAALFAQRRAAHLARVTVGFAWPEFRATRLVAEPARLRQLAAALARARRAPPSARPWPGRRWTGSGPGTARP